MLTNHLYDILNELVVKSRDLYRLDRYIKDCGKCADCKNLWKELKKSEERQIAMLSKISKSHMK